MNETVTYELTEDMQRAAVMASATAKGIRPSLALTLGFILSALGILGLAGSGNPISFVILLAGVIWLTLPLRYAISCRRMVKDARRVLADSKVTVNISDEALAISSNGNSVTIAWRQVTKVYDKRETLLFYSGSLFRGYLPKSVLTGEQIAFIKARVARAGEGGRHNEHN